MNWQMLWWLPNWLAARVLDGVIAGEGIPDVLAAWGVVTLAVAAVVFAWMVASWWLRRRAERDQPPPGNLLDSQEWLVDRTEEIPIPPRSRYRGRRRAPREPRKRRPRQHVVPAHPVRFADATRFIPAASDAADGTLIIPAVYGGRCD